MSKVTLGGNPIDVAGRFPQAGDAAPAFKLTGADLADVGLDAFAGKRKVLNIVPSLDTPVCATSTRKFNEEAGKLANTVVLVVSALALGVFTAWATDDASNVGSSLGAGLALVTPTALIISTCGMLQALSPRLAQLAWTLVGWATVVAMLAEALGLPEWARMASPFYAAGQVPIQDPDAAALLSIQPPCSRSVATAC